MKHNDTLTTKDHAGTGFTLKTTNLLKNDKLLVRFEVEKTPGNLVPVFAKLHLLQVTKEAAGVPDEIMGQHPIGQEIDPPTTMGMGHFQFANVNRDNVQVKDTNVVLVTIGDVVYQVVTNTDLR